MITGTAMIHTIQIENDENFDLNLSAKRAGDLVAEDDILDELDINMQQPFIDDLPASVIEDLPASPATTMRLTEINIDMNINKFECMVKEELIKHRSR